LRCQSGRKLNPRAKRSDKFAKKEIKRSLKRWGERKGNEDGRLSVEVEE
jgi:hypothetical protein